MRRENIKKILVGLLFMSIIVLTYGGEPWWVRHKLYQRFPNSTLKVISNSSSLSEKEAAIKEFEEELARGGRNKQEAAAVLGYEQNFDVLDSYTEGRTTYWLVQYPNLDRFGASREELVPIRFTPWAFLPSAAQFYKGQIGKGVGILAGEVVFLGGLIGAASMAPVYESRIASTHNVDLKNRYANRAQMMKNLEYVCIGGFVAVYVWNVIDGCVSKGHKYRVRNGRGSYGAHLELTPSIVDPGNLALSLKF